MSIPHLFILIFINAIKILQLNHLISSSVGAQQGHPYGPMIFSLANQPVILSLDSQLNIWYLDWVWNLS
jgi:hypothetical protein